MALENARRDRVDLLPVGDVADLPLSVELTRERLEQILPAGKQDAVPAAAVERTRRRLADAGRRPGDDRYPPAAHRRVTLSV